MNELKIKSSPSILLLAGKGDSTNIVYHSLKKEFNIKLVIIEDSPSKIKLFLYRKKKLGLSKAFGQVLFSLIIIKSLNFFYRNRINSLKSLFSFNDSSIPLNKVQFVKSVNSDETRKLIRNIKTDLILVNGTRIIGDKTLSCTSTKFVNTHSGVTPMYRGVHGGYWALINDDLKSFGVTIHFVDNGVDTGNIIAQSTIIPTKKDCFVTYPLLQLNFGIKLLKNNLRDVINGNDNKINNNVVSSVSNQYFHPTIFSYLYYLITKGVK